MIIRRQGVHTMSTHNPDTEVKNGRRRDNSAAIRTLVIKVCENSPKGKAACEEITRRLPLSDATPSDINNNLREQAKFLVNAGIPEEEDLKHFVRALRPID
jgi:hypothetical protein